MLGESRLATFRQRYAALLDPLLCSLDRGLRGRLDLSSVDSIVVVGNQKTGSTAIAGLLARLGGLSFAPDVRSAWESEPELIRGDLSLSRFIQENRFYFRKDVVKENALTFCLEGLRKALPEARLVYTIRSPVANIRSILDRLGLPGEPRNLNDIEIPPGVWRRVADIRWLGEDVEDVISSLARRWVLTADQYLELAEEVHLVRYESFCADKARAIRSLAEGLGVEARQDIAGVVDQQFQPRGRHRNVVPDRFFTPGALTRIQSICDETARELGYE